MPKSLILMENLASESSMDFNFDYQNCAPDSDAREEAFAGDLDLRFSTHSAHDSAVPTDLSSLCEEVRITIPNAEEFSNICNDEDFESDTEDALLCRKGIRLVSCDSEVELPREDVVLCINAGGRAVKGTLDFGDDKCFVGGDVLRTDESIAEWGPCVYQSARYGDFCYNVQDLPAGDYMVDLYFAEIVFTNGPPGMRVFDVFIQDRKILSGLDIYARVGSNTPFVLLDARAKIVEGSALSVRFQSVVGSPIVCGICIRKAPLLLEIKWQTVGSSDSLKSSLDVATGNANEGHYAQFQITRTDENWEHKIRRKTPKCIAEYERKIEELTREYELKKNECHEAWMSLNDSNRQNENLRTELDSMSFHVEFLDQTVEGQRELQDTYQQKKVFWASSVQDLKAKIQILKRDYDTLSEEAHKCASAIPDIAGMTSAVQYLVLQCEDLKMKFNKETMERKKLYDKVLELKGNIRVFCRCRPLSDEEISAGASSVMEFDTTRDNELGIRINGTSKKVFKFDRVFTTQDDQVAVFADTAPVVVSVLDGYNVCIFAYGQTGTGKTFTMEGTRDNRGVNYRTLEELFRVATERNGLFKYDISVSVLEVYNEQIRDLLASSTQPGHTVKRLEIKQVAEGVHHVPGLVEAQVHTMNEVWDVLQTGSSARAVGSTNANEHSSRSHCVLCVMVKGENLISGESTRSKLWLVDLAGSERIAKTDVQGERLKEAQSINKSLSALGDVISALATKNSHIPYRNSKLTHLLQDSLGGDSKTLMFVQISPNENDSGETLSSLNFATRVRGIELGPARKQLDSSDLLKYKQMFEKAKQEGKVKDDMMKKMEENMQNLDVKLKGKEQHCRHFQEKVKELEGQLETRLKEQQQQWEKEIMQYGEKYRGKEQMCRNLQEKVKDLEAQLEAKVKGQQLQKQKELEEQLEIRLKEQRQQSEKERLQYLEKLKGKEQMCRNLQEKVKDLEAQLEAKVKEQQSLSQKVSEKPPPVHQSGGLRNINEKSAFRKDQINPVDPLTENRFRLATPDNINSGNQQERGSLTKADMMDPHLQGGLIPKENNGKLEDLPPRFLSRRTGHVSTCNTTGRTNVTSATRRVSMLSTSVTKNEIPESSIFNKDGGGRNGDHIQHYDTDDSLAVLRGPNTSNKLNRFRRGIHNNKVQSRKEKQNTNTDDESIVASATSSSGEQNVPPIDNGRLKHSSTARARAKVNAGAQRVDKIKGWTR